LEDRNNLRPSSPRPVAGCRPGTTLQFCGPKFGSGIRRFDGEALGGRRLARTPPRRVTRSLGFDNRTTGSRSDRGALFSRPWFQSPSRFWTAKSRRGYSAVARGQLKGE